MGRFREHTIEKRKRTKVRKKKKRAKLAEALNRQLGNSDPGRKEIEEMAGATIVTDRKVKGETEKIACDPSQEKRITIARKGDTCEPSLEEMQTMATDRGARKGDACEPGMEEMQTKATDRGARKGDACEPSLEEMQTMATDRGARKGDMVKTTCEPSQEKVTTMARKDKGDAKKTANCTPSREHCHAVVFYNNWMKSEKANLQLIAMKDIKITKRNCGKGSYGVCDVGTYGVNCVAVKTIERWNESKIEEAMILRKLRHPNIQMYFGLAWQGNDAHIISKFHGMKGMSVTLAKAGEQNILKKENWKITVTQICDAVKYLHLDSAILHNDIKSNNIIVEEDGNAEHLVPILIDFGKACFIHEARAIPKKRDSSKFPFLAPELDKGEKQSVRSDIFSLGYTLRHISHTIQNFSFRQIYRSCLKQVPSERPGIETILWQLKDN